MSGFISKETIDQVNNTTDIVSLVGEYTKLERRSGNDFWGCCPFHQEKTASFHVDGDKKFYYCFSCHASGSAVKFLMETEKVGFADAVTSLAKRSGIEIRYENGTGPKEREYDNTKDLIIELYDRTASMFHYILMETPQGKEALEYLLKRGLNKEIIEKFRLGYAPQDRKWLKSFLRSKNFSDDFLEKSGLFSKKYPDISFFSDRVMCPIFNRQGQTVAFSGRILHSNGPDDRKYLNTGEMVQYKKRETLYGFNFAKNAIRNSKSVIFCEGNMDVIAYHQAGIEYAVATCGTALTEDHLKMVKGFAETILLSFDSDSAGQKATFKSIIMCRNAGFSVKIIQLKGGKDPSEILQKFGKENLTNQVDNSIIDCDYLLNKLGELYPVGTPEGKTKAALAFFTYVDSLQTNTQKVSSLEQLCQVFQLNPEAVKKDFVDRNQARERINNNKLRQPVVPQENNPDIKLNAEIRGILAVVSNPEQFSVLSSQINENDFTDQTALLIFKILESCSREGTLSFPEILNRCQNSNLTRLLTESISSGVYKPENAAQVVSDYIKYLKMNSLEVRRNNLNARISNFRPVTEEDKNLLKQMISEKMNLDAQAQTLKK